MVTSTSARCADTETVNTTSRTSADTFSTDHDYDAHDDRVENPHAGTCSGCDAYPVPTKGGLCPSCRLPVEAVTDPCGCSGAERSAS